MNGEPFNDRWEREKIEAFQFDLLEKQLNYLWERSKFYKKKLQAAGLTPSDIKTLADLRKIPPTSKNEFKNHSADFICARKEDIVDYCSTSGTTGKPVLIPLSWGDWRCSIQHVKDILLRRGIERSDIVQHTLAFDQLFAVSVLFDTALKEMGATSLRLGPGNSKRQIEVMRETGTTVILATPDYMLALAETARGMGLDPRKDFQLKKAILFAQSLYTKDWKPNALRKEVEEAWNIDILAGYGATETSLGAYECLAHGGHHVLPQYFISEVIDPVTLEVLEPGKPGELVFTPLRQEAMPVLRFRQGDISYLLTDRCACGSNAPRVMSLLGRTDEMIKIKGTSFYPHQIENVLLAIPEISCYVMEVFSDGGGQDRLKIKAFITKNQEAVVERIRDDIKGEIRLTPLVEPKSSEEIEAQVFSQGTRKAKIFWDLRPTK